MKSPTSAWQKISFVVLVPLFLLLSVFAVANSESFPDLKSLLNHTHTNNDNSDDNKYEYEYAYANPSQSPPNIVIILTDDLDSTVGGANASTLTKTRHLLGGQGMGGMGKSFDNWFVQTPVCCVSRAELLTGRLFHNLRVANVSERGCMHVDVNETDPNHPFWKDYYFSKFFSDLDYSVGLFGKHLNPPHNPTTFMPNGVDEMLINGGGNYLDPSFTHGTRRNPTVSNATTKERDYHIEDIHFNNCTNSTGMPCYSTSVIGNASLVWIRKQVKAPKSKPFFAFVSVKAPHIQDRGGFPMAIPAPWYQNTTLVEKLAPRTPSYNYSGTNHHWLVRSQPPLTTLEAQKVDELYVSRLKTLLSVDDLVHDLVHELDRLKVLDNTYVIFTSDHGYRLGQFRIPQCKLHPYENDIRVPMMIRGPGIGSQPPLVTPNTNKKQTESHQNQDYQPQALFSHVHLMPTLLGLATGEHYSQDILPTTMDGTNLAGLLLDQGRNLHRNHQTVVSPNTTAATSSVSLLVEYTSLGNVVRYQHLVDTFNHSFVALRIMPAYHHENQLPINTTNENNSSTDTSSIKHISNLKYIEFRDSRVDWNNTGPPLERELYDLDQDPYELNNLLALPNKVSISLLLALDIKMKRLVACSGDDCRKEHSTGLDPIETDAMALK